MLGFVVYLLDIYKVPRCVRHGTRCLKRVDLKRARMFRGGTLKEEELSFTLDNCARVYFRRLG